MEDVYRLRKDQRRRTLHTGSGSGGSKNKSARNRGVLNNGVKIEVAPQTTGGAHVLDPEDSTLTDDDDIHNAIDALQRNISQTQLSGNKSQFRFEEEQEWASASSAKTVHPINLDLHALDRTLSRLKPRMRLLGLKDDQRGLCKDSIILTVESPIVAAMAPVADFSSNINSIQKPPNEIEREMELDELLSLHNSTHPSVSSGTYHESLPTDGNKSMDGDEWLDKLLSS